MQGIVDRFEGSKVVIEIEGKTKDFDKSQVAEHVAEGDVVVLRDGRWVKDQETTEKRTQHIKKLMDQLWDD